VSIVGYRLYDARFDSRQEQEFFFSPKHTERKQGTAGNGKEATRVRG
jgi:hypothetical protein